MLDRILDKIENLNGRPFTAKEFIIGGPVLTAPGNNILIFFALYGALTLVLHYSSFTLLTALTLLLWMSLKAKPLVTKLYNRSDDWISNMIR